MPTQDSSHQVKPADTARYFGPEDLSQIEELQATLASLVAEVKKVIESRATQIRDVAVEGAEESVGFARDTIRSYPIMSICAAALFGAVLAMAFSPATTRTRLERLSNWRPDISRADIEDMAKSVQRSASATGSTLLGAVERVADSVVPIDPKSSLIPAIEKLAKWFNSVQSNAK